MAWVAGVDGCKVGWIVVLKDVDKSTFRSELVNGVSGLLQLPEKPSVIALDMPIGLLDEASTGGRECDIICRKNLGPRASSVFPPPVRASLAAFTYSEAVKINRESSPENIGISQQSFAIFPKLREVDNALTPELQGSIVEIHPELCFFALNGNRPMLNNKKKSAGQAERIAQLESNGFNNLQRFVEVTRRPGIEIDDVLDACVACWTAERIHKGIAIRIPASPPFDSKGLRMEMWR